MDDGSGIDEGVDDGASVDKGLDDLACVDEGAGVDEVVDRVPNISGVDVADVNVGVDTEV